MKKLWNYEWKYHFCFVIITLLVLCGGVHKVISSYREEIINMINESNNTETIQNYISDEIMLDVTWMLEEYTYCFLVLSVIVVVVLMVIKKSFIYFIETNSYGTDFLQTLPIRKNERFCFHLLMDVLTVVITLVVIDVYGFCVLHNVLSQIGIEIPWLIRAQIGTILVNISYTLMVLGVVYIVESIFVNGPMKLIGCLGTGFILTLVINILGHKYASIPFVENLHRFLTKNLFVDSLFLEEYNLRYNVVNEDGLNIYQIWIDEHVAPFFLLNGEKMNSYVLNDNESQISEMIHGLKALYGFMNVNSYIVNVIGYLLLAVIFIGIAKYLHNKQEASKESFYFGFAKYVVSGFISCAFLVVLMVNWKQGWHQVICVLASILLFIVLVCLFDIDIYRKLMHRKRIVDNNQSV